MCAEAIVEGSENGKRMVDERDLRKYLEKWDKTYWPTFKVLDVLQRVFYRSNPAREAFVEMCADEYVQKMTFDSYSYKRVAPGNPLQGLKLAVNTIGSLVRANALKKEMDKLSVATNTLERVAPLTHAVGNVLKRVFVIGFSIVISVEEVKCIEGPQLMQYGFRGAIAKVGLYKFLSDLFWIGMFYHLYNQVATNTLERVAPLTHAVGNVLKRVFVIGFSIVVFGNRISTQTGIGTIIAIVGVAIYSLIRQT
ncbi:hypothetical protein SO802_020774 [Lithocarpus litseifolius]|uniref:Sugar phosphate transporter domain-containing protein n=1 Tax=Lithocarpus litseifolius TaxID=425828 RepID=A0AAW2CEI9_9ROSI